MGFGNTSRQPGPINIWIAGVLGSCVQELGLSGFPKGFFTAKPDSYVFEWTTAGLIHALSTGPYALNT